MPIRFNIKSIPLSAIDMADRRFLISDPRSVTLLVDSVRTTGLLIPPLVSPVKGDRYCIVSGFLRVAACKELAFDTVTVRIAAGDTAGKELAWAAISENALARELTVMEKVRAVTLLERHHSDKRAITDLIRPLGIDANPKMVAKLSRLARLPNFIHAAVEKRWVGLAMALTLGQLKPNEAQHLINLFQTLKLGLNRQREALTLIQEIAKRESLSLEAVLATNGIATILDDAQEERVRCTRDFLYYLRKWRYPALSQREEAFRQLKKELKLGPQTQLHPPPYFEGATYRLTLGFASLVELDLHRQTLGELCADSGLKKLLD